MASVKKLYPIFFFSFYNSDPLGVGFVAGGSSDLYGHSGN